jgi:hypothetical protein
LVWLAPKLLAACPGGSQTGFHPLAQQITLELGKACHHAESTVKCGEVAFFMVMLARIVDAFFPQNLPAKDPPFGHQSDDLAPRVGFFIDYDAGVTRRFSSCDGMRRHSPVSV